MNKTQLIFVFGSNYLGVHGGGAALTAYHKWGAVWGRRGAVGLSGNSYAIPTKYDPGKTLPLDAIQWYVKIFVSHAKQHEHMDRKYIVTRIGCGLAGYTDEEIAPLFVGCGPNCIFDITWKHWLGANREYFAFDERTGEMKLPCAP